jgi:glycosyltransferase involved in cell wall biosynthesis
MKVLQIINCIEGGGAENLVIQLHQIYLQMGIDSHVIGLQYSSKKIPNTYSLGFQNLYKLSVFTHLYNFLNTAQWQDVDVIHVHLFPSQVYAALTYKLLGLSSVLITTEHSTANSRRGTVWGKWIDHFTYSFYQKIACVSQGARDNIVRWQPQLELKSLVVYNGILLKQDAFTQSKNSQCPVLISVGRLAPPKNHENTLKALSQLDDVAFEYWIVGSGALEKDLKELTLTLKLDHKVKFLGFREDVFELLQQADVYLQVSLWEGLPLSVVEAMSTGLPAVVSQIPVMLELFPQGSEAAFLANPKSSDEIAMYLRQLLSSLPLRSKMGFNAKELAQRFDIHQTAKNYLNLYASIS